MPATLSQEYLRDVEARLFSRAEQMRKQAMVALTTVESKQLPPKINHSIHEFEKLLARADIVYSAARDLKAYRKTLRTIAEDIRLVAGQTLGARAQEMLRRAEIVEQWVQQIKAEYQKAIAAADAYEAEATQARKSYEKAKAEHRRRYGPDAPDYDDYLSQKQTIEREMAEDWRYFDAAELATATGDDFWSSEERREDLW